MPWAKEQKSEKNEKSGKRSKWDIAEYLLLCSFGSNLGLMGLAFLRERISTPIYAGIAVVFYICVLYLVYRYLKMIFSVPMSISLVVSAVIISAAYMLRRLLDWESGQGQDVFSIRLPLYYGMEEIVEVLSCICVGIYFLYLFSHRERKNQPEG